MSMNSTAAIVAGGLAAVGVALVVGAARLFRRGGRSPTGPVRDEAPGREAEVAFDPQAHGDEPSNADRPELPLDYFGLVLALTVPFWLLGERPLPVPMKLPASALAAFNPLLAAVILTYWRKGRSGVRELLRRALDYRKIRPRRWYLPILLLNPAIMLLSYAVMRIARLPLPEPQIPWLVAPALFLVFLVFGVGEELGWMGYAFDPLQKRWGALWAAIGLGLVWGLFHLIPDLQNQQAANWIFWQRMGSVGVRILIVWLYNNTGRSVFATILFHAMNNLSWTLFPNYGSHYNPLVTGVITLGAAALVLLVWGPKTLAHNRFGRFGGAEAGDLQKRGTI